MRRTRVLLASALSTVVAAGLVVVAWPAGAANVVEGFETAPPATWKVQNNSATIGSTTWRQGTTAFPAQDGPPLSYARVDFNSTTGTNTIDNWLITPPQTTLSNGDTWSFWTRAASATFADNLEVRMSTNGASCSPGTATGGVGDFTTTLLVINPTLARQGAAGSYPTVWSAYGGALSGLPAGNSIGCLAFRYYVPAGGPGSSTNSFAIGVDSYSLLEGGTVPASTTTATATAGATTTTTATATATTTSTATAGPVATTTATQTASASATTTTNAPTPAQSTATATVTPSTTTAPSTCQPALSALYAAQSTAANAGAKAFKSKLAVKRAVGATQKKKAAAKAKKAKAAAAAATAALTAAETASRAACR